MNPPLPLSGIILKRVFNSYATFNRNIQVIYNSLFKQRQELVVLNFGVYQRKSPAETGGRLQYIFELTLQFGVFAQGFPCGSNIPHSWEHVFAPSVCIKGNHPSQDILKEKVSHPSQQLTPGKRDVVCEGTIYIRALTGSNKPIIN